MPRCRSCGSDLHQTFVDLGNQPLSNGYLAAPTDPDPVFPLHARVCTECLLVQADEVVAPDNIFATDYAFRSGASTPWVGHCRRYVRQMMRQFTPATVLEVGSNDGTLLDQFPDYVETCGVDPTGHHADFPEFFTEKLAWELGQYDLVVANNVLGHVPDLNDFVAGLRTVVAPDGIATIEVPWLWNLISECQYDTIYHEHFSYFSLIALERLFAAHRLEVFDAERLTVHGGSLRLFVQHEGATRPHTDGVNWVRHHEQDFGLNRPMSPLYTQFSDRAARHSSAIRTFFLQARAEGKTVVGAGAPAKGNTLLNTARITPELMTATTDTTPAKQGTYLPGSHVEVVAPDYLDEHEPDYVFVLAWNWAPTIIENLAYIRDWGGQFVTPIPRLQFA